MALRIGIFGGTFDPPHLGHLILASESRYQLKLDRMLFVLTPDPPHKRHRQLTPVEDRLAMVAAAVLEDPAFVLSTVEVDRPGPHYAVDTVNLLRKEYPEDALVYMMGGDSLRDLPNNWHRPADFVDACDEIGVMRRLGDKIDERLLKEQLPGLAGKLHFVEAPLLEIASRQVRRRVQEGRPYKYYLPEGVIRVIEERGLYR
ncbi:MAG: nicotinate-nucleotide adenylyltransferase [Anaerolineae bacterium]|nr:nicotinate-nucleotide adenylyltransferase [Anaerolineae bacterium]